MKRVTRIIGAFLVAVWFMLASPGGAAAARTAGEYPWPEAGAAEETADSVLFFGGRISVSGVEDEIARTDRLLDRIRERALKPAPPALQRAYDSAADAQMSAKRRFERGEYSRALELTRQARRLAARLVARAAGTFDPEHVARALRLTDGFVEEAGEVARRRGSDSLAKRVGEARRLQVKAHEQLARRNYGGAYRLSLEAREVMKDAVGAKRPVFDDTGVREELVKTDEEIRRVRDSVVESGAAARHALDQAIAEQDAAWEEFGGRQLLAALAHTRISRSLLRQALEARD